MYTVIKFGLSAIIVVAVSEIAKRSTVIGALIASLPLTSLLAISWLYAETKDIEKVAGLTNEIFWLVIPSLIFFALFPILLRMRLGFGLCMISAIVVTGIGYAGTIALRRFLSP